MSYYEKIVRIFTGKKPVLLLIAGLFALTSTAQDRAKFSGEWKLNESKSEVSLLTGAVYKTRETDIISI